MRSLGISEEQMKNVSNPLEIHSSPWRIWKLHACYWHVNLFMGRWKCLIPIFMSNSKAHLNRLCLELIKLFRLKCGSNSIKIESNWIIYHIASAHILLLTIYENAIRLIAIRIALNFNIKQVCCQHVITTAVHHLHKWFRN